MGANSPAIGKYPHGLPLALMLWIVGGVCFLAFPANAGAAGPEKDAAGRGREIYQFGVDADGSQIQCVTGPQGTEVPAAILKCVSCHGHDGRGKAEGGVYPANIRWSELTKPYSVPVPGGRKRPPYSERLLIRAITLGLDANDSRLNATMPRYRLSHQQAADLVAYLKELDHENDPGVTDDSITLGIVLPPESLHGGMHRAVRETATAALDVLNRDGGIYGRKILCRFTSAPLENQVAAFEEFIEREQPFALLESYVAGNEQAIAEVIERHHIPMIQPITLSTGWQPRSAHHIFHLTSGVEGQCAALLKFAAERQDMAAARSLLVVNDRPANQLLEEMTHAISGERAGNLRTATIADIGDWSAYLRNKNPAVIVWLASGHALDDFFAAADRLNIYPFLLAPGILAGERIYHAPKGFNERIFLSFPILPDDQTLQGRAEFARLAESHHFSEGDYATRISTLSAVKLLVATLTKAGREITRENVVTNCEQFYELGFGQMRPVSFGPDRRVGTTGAHVIGVDLGKGCLVLPSRWIECDVR